VNLDKGLVLDSNILIRAVLGRRVLQLLVKYRDAAAFCCPDRCFDDARKYLPGLCARRKLDAVATLETLDKLNVIVQSIRAASTAIMKLLRVNASKCATLTIGRWQLWRSCLVSPFGPKIPISSAAALPPGPLIELNFTFGGRNSRPKIFTSPNYVTRKVT